MNPGNYQRAKGLREITRNLNRLTFRPPRGRQWYASGVRNLFALYTET